MPSPACRASGAAAYVHYHLLFDPRYTSFCDVNATVSCTQVYQSRFSTVHGIPVAIFGAIWFAGASLLSVTGMAARDNVRENIPGYLFVVSTLALAVVLYLEYVSFVIMKAVCLLCLVMAAAVVGLFFVSGAATSFPMTSLPRRAIRDLRTLVSTARSPSRWPCCSLAAPARRSPSSRAKAPSPPPTGSAAVPGSRAPASAAVGIRALHDDARRACRSIIPAEGAKVLIVKFNDFQCPPCGKSYLAVQADSSRSTTPSTLARCRSC